MRRGLWAVGCGFEDSKQCASTQKEKQILRSAWDTPLGHSLGCLATNILWNNCLHLLSLVITNAMLISFQGNPVQVCLFLVGRSCNEAGRSLSCIRAGSGKRHSD